MLTLTNIFYMKNLAPIALFAYNRPEHLERTLRSLAANALASSSDLFIFSDGPKTDKDKKNVDAVRSLIRAVTGFKSVKIVENSVNVGLAENIINGVTTLVNNHGKVIVMEDDLESSLYLLQYMNDALNFYEHNEQVMHIGAYMYPINPEALPETFFFRLVTSSGWATWKRAWDYFEPDIEKLNTRFDKEKIHAFSIEGTENFWKIFREFRAGKNNSWATRWYAGVFLQNGLALHPAKSMTNNIGHDASGTHSGVSDMYAVTVADKPINFFPADIRENEEAVERIKHFFRTRKGSWYQRGKRYAATRIKKLLR